MQLDIYSPLNDLDIGITLIVGGQHILKARKVNMTLMCCLPTTSTLLHLLCKLFIPVNKAS